MRRSTYYSYDALVSHSHKCLFWHCSAPHTTHTHTHSLAIRYEHRNDCNVLPFGPSRRACVRCAHTTVSFDSYILREFIYADDKITTANDVMCAREQVSERVSLMADDTLLQRQPLLLQIPVMGVCVCVSDVASWKIEKKISLGAFVSYNMWNADFFASLLLVALMQCSD